MQFPKIISVKALGKYKIQAKFNDGTEGVYDLSDMAGKGVFKSWEEDDNFNKVFINPESGAVTWPGDIDIDTLNLYCNIKGIDIDDFIKNQKPYATYL